MNVLILTFLIVLFDQATKLYVKGIKIPFLGIEFDGIPYQSSIPVIGKFFQITFIENPGMAFGLQIGGKLFLSLFTIFATVLLFFFLYKNRNETLLLRLALALILGGAIGNLIDRVFYGKIYGYAPYFYGRVVDFLHIDLPNFTVFGKTISSWPIFNIADISVTVGFLMILLGYKKIFEHEEEFDSSDEEEYLYESGKAVRHVEFFESPVLNVNSKFVTDKLNAELEEKQNINETSPGDSSLSKNEMHLDLHDSENETAEPLKRDPADSNNIKD